MGQQKCYKLWQYVIDLCQLELLFLVRVECMRMNVVRALADVVATKLGIIGAKVVRAHKRFPCGGRCSGH